MKKSLLSFAIIIVILAISILVTGCIIARGPRSTIFSSKDSWKGYLGVYPENVTRKIVRQYDLPVEHGAYISSVVDDSPADNAGIQEGDVIVKFDGEPIRNASELREAIDDTKPRRQVEIELYRSSERMTLTARIDKTGSPDVEIYSLGHVIDIPEHHTIHISRPSIIINTSTDELDGLQLEELTDQLGEYFGASGGKGVLVSRVQNNSEAGHAGFKAGDVIVKIGGTYTVEEISDIDDAVNHYHGKKVVFDIIRDGKPATIDMKIEEDNNEDEDDN